MAQLAVLQFQAGQLLVWRLPLQAPTHLALDHQRFSNPNVRRKLMGHPSNRPTLADLEELFTYHPPNAIQELAYTNLRKAAKQFATVILQNTPPSADQSAAIRKVRETIMTANAAVALDPAYKEPTGPPPGPPDPPVPPFDRVG